MHTTIVSYLRGHGWTAPLPTELDSERTLVLAFGASSFFDERAPLAALRAALPRANLMGCSTAGEIQNTKVLDESIVAAVIRFDATELRSAIAPITNAAESRAAGESIARQLAAPDLRGVFILSDGRLVNGSEL